MKRGFMGTKESTIYMNQRSGCEKTQKQGQVTVNQITPGMQKEALNELENFAWKARRKRAADFNRHFGKPAGALAQVFASQPWPVVHRENIVKSGKTL